MSQDHVLRISTGHNHQDAVKVLAEIRDKLNNENMQDQDIEMVRKKLHKLFITADKLDRLSTKNEKQIERYKLTRDIASYNRKIVFLRGKDTTFHQIPTINTKARPANGKKAQLLKEGLVTYPIQDKDTIYTSISLCSKRKTLCLAMDKDDINNFIITQLEKPDTFKLVVKSTNDYDVLIDVFHKRTFQFILKAININCSKCNDKLIKLAQFWPHIKPDKKNITEVLIWKLYENLVQKSFGLNIVYCLDSKCKYASQGIMVQKINEMENTFYYRGEIIFCNICQKNHHVHAHRTICPSKICHIKTFCSVCKTTPYHEKEVCQGPIDEEIDPIILQTTKPCPGCRFRTQKSDGCDKIACCKCGVCWCWRCIQKLNQNDPYLHICLDSSVVDGKQDGSYRDFAMPEYNN